jgi:lysophospholipase L1-like esterase
VPPLLYGRAGCAGGTLGSAAVASLSNRTQVLFLGSSHVLFGIRPQRYSVGAMNLAATWLDYSCVRSVVEKHLPRVPNVKVVVIEYDELPLVCDLVPVMIGTNDPRALGELELTPLEFPADGLAERLGVLRAAWTYPLTVLPRVTPLGWTNRTNSCSPLYHPSRGFAPGFFYADWVTPPSYDFRVFFAALTSAAQNERVVQRNLRALEETIALLRRRGVTVVLLRLPHSREYASRRPPIVAARWRQLQERLRALSQRDERLLLLDWGEKGGFQPADFCDDNHLNVFGADKLARLLDARLRALCGDAL